MITIEEAQEISGIGYWELDFTKDQLTWSNQVYKIFRVDPTKHDPSYELFLGLVHPDDRDKVDHAYNNSLETKKPYEIQHRIIFEDDSIGYVIEKCETTFDNEGKPVKSIGSIQDVTRYVDYQIKLKASQEKFMAISNQTTEGITVADLEGNYVFVNPAFCKMSGYSEKELLSMTVFDMKAKDQDHSSFKNSKEKMEGKAIRVKLEKKDGTEYLTEIIGDVIEVDGKNLVLGTIRDISETVKNEELIRQLNKDLEARVRERTAQLDQTVERLSEEVERRKEIEGELKDSLEIKEVLLKEITHRVKNNMQIISSLINLQKSHLDNDSCDFLDQITHRIHSMALIHETLSKSDKFEEIEFKDYLSSLIHYIKDSFDSNKFSIDLKAENHILPLDVATSCGMIVIELVTNSIKHAFKNIDKGLITISFSQPKENHFLLTVADNGPGLPKNINFKNTKSLGLQLVVNLVEQISGTIEQSSDNGSKFEISFKL